MSLGPLHDLECNGERTPAIVTTHRHGRVATHRCNEALQFARERLRAITNQCDALDQILDPHRRHPLLSSPALPLSTHEHRELRCDARLQSQILALSCGQVDADITGTLEEPDLAHALE